MIIKQRLVLTKCPDRVTTQPTLKLQQESKRRMHPTRYAV
jgi:hypothetical protein